jgi:hypothetical protein
MHKCTNRSKTALTIRCPLVMYEYSNCISALHEHAVVVAVAASDLLIM